VCVCVCVCVCGIPPVEIHCGSDRTPVFFNHFIGMNPLERLLIAVVWGAVFGIDFYYVNTTQCICTYGVRNLMLCSLWFVLFEMDISIIFR